MLHNLIQLSINGICLGGVYAATAISINIIFSATGALNFGQGEFALLGAYLTLAATDALGMSVPFASLAVAVLVGLFGATLFQRCAYWPLRNRETGLVVVTTLGAGLSMRNMVRVIWGGMPKVFPSQVQGLHRVGGFVVVNQHLLVLFVTGLLMGGLFVILTKTRVGMMLRATAQDKEVAQLMGISVRRMIGFGFFLSSFIGAVTGVIVAPIFVLTLEMGFSIMIKGFCAAVIGGFGNLAGAVVGGILLGVLEVLAAGFLSSLYKDAYAFVILVIVLWLRPTGLFGETAAEKV